MASLAHRWLDRIGVAAVAGALLSSCAINPQPEPPAQGNEIPGGVGGSTQYDAGTMGGGSGAGGASAGGAGGGVSGSGGNAGLGGAAPYDDAGSGLYEDADTGAQEDAEAPDVQDDGVSEDAPGDAVLDGDQDQGAVDAAPAGDGEADAGAADGSEED